MKQSVFKTEFTASGVGGYFKGEVVATMNYNSKTVTGTHAGTHDDFSKQVPVHKVEAFLNGELRESQNELVSEKEILQASSMLIEKLRKTVDEKASTPKSQTFTEKMQELFR